MSYIDKINFLTEIKNYDYVALELGCGLNKANPKFIGIDVLDYPNVDIVGDIFEVLSACPTSSVDLIFSSHFFEHIDKLELLLSEIARVLKKSGVLEIIVPHFSNPYYYSDYSHKTTFGLYSMSYFSVDNLFKRKVPVYNKKLQYELREVRLVFQSSRPFYFRYLLKKLIQIFVNLNSYTKEFYEENLCYMFPCYGISYKLTNKGE